MMMDTDFPAVMANGGDGVGFLREYLRGFQSYQQAGTDIPDRSLRTDYGQEQGGPLIARTIRYTPPNAIIKAPHLDSPYMDKLFERDMKPMKPPGPKGPQLPSFV
jgi:hypothetical protein